MVLARWRRFLGYLGRWGLPQLLGVSSFLALWQIVAMQYNTVVLPSPLETGAAIQRLMLTGAMGQTILTTSIRLSIAVAIALLFGIILGIIAGLKPMFRKAISPLISALQGIPPIAWIVLALLWFGNGGAAPVFTITITMLPIIFIGTVEGMGTFPSSLLDMAHLYHAPQRQLLVDAYFPHLLTALFPSIAAGLGLAWRVAVMAELLSSETGIGATLNLARINLDTDEVMAWIVIVVALIWISEYGILRPLRRWLEPWHFPRNNLQSPPTQLSNPQT